MQKSSTLKNFQDFIPIKIKNKGALSLKPSKFTIDFIMAYAAALSVFKTKSGVYNVLKN